MSGTKQIVAVMVLSATALTGCMSAMGDSAVSRFLSTPQSVTERTAVPNALASRQNGLEASPSPVISDLAARHSVLIAGSPYAEVAAGVLAADARVAEAELHVAQLRAKAAARNGWPTIAPRISLTSLGDVVADLVINQMLFDNGRKQAERDLAKADVELAAVALSESSNARVYSGLMLYLEAERGRAASDLYAQALKDLGHFEWVMQERVAGGVSDISDLNVLRQRLSDLHARDTAARETTQRAMAELAAISDVPLTDQRGVRGMSALPALAANDAPGPGMPALDVLRATVERDRQLAQARIARAAHLPNLSAGGSLRQGARGLALNVGSEQRLGLGTRASLDALEAATITANRKVTEAETLSRRAFEADQRMIAALKRQRHEAKTLKAQAKANLEQFQRQYDAGTRQVMEVVGVYDTYLRTLEHALDLKFQGAQTELGVAQRLGVLVDGAKV